MITNIQPVDTVPTEAMAIEQLKGNSLAVEFETNHTGRCECGESQSVVSRDKNGKMIDFRVVCSGCGEY